MPHQSSSSTAGVAAPGSGAGSGTDGEQELDENGTPIEKEDEVPKEKHRFVYLACSPFPLDQRCPKGLRNVLATENWIEDRDFRKKTHFFHLFQDRITIPME